MSKLIFDSSGRLVGLNRENSEKKLQTSDSLDFLKEDSPRKVGDIFEKNFWSLYENDAPLNPLRFSNGKTQEDVVREVHSLINQGKKIIFLHGACGTGKSAIALNLARLMGKTSVIVPVKTLQTQYEKDYSNKKYLLKPSGEKIKIAMITGRENHDSIIKPGVSCADSFLPDTIKITEKNFRQIKEYYESNPFIRSKDLGELKKLRRMSIAPANPHWSPIIQADYGVNHLTDAKKYDYTGCDGKKYTFYHRKSGCSYYDQYLAYNKSDVIIFNSAKYLSELSSGRKPLTEVDIIDESDVFLDSFFEQSELNLTWLANSLGTIGLEDPSSKESVEEILMLIGLEEKNKRATGVDESKIFKIEDTNVKKMLQIFNSNQELQTEISLDELNYSNKAVEISKNFSGNSEGIYITYRKEDENLYARIVSTDLSYKINDLLSKTRSIVFMSGTIHSKEILDNIFQIKDYSIVEAETMNSGSVEIIMTGKEIDCRYSNFSSGKHSREDYLRALSSCIEKSESPTLVHVQSFQDLPSKEEKDNFNLPNLMTREDLILTQNNDRFGREIEDFKKGKFPTLFSTRCARGVDFPGESCNSIVFTKYPNSNVKDVFWEVIKQTHPNYYWNLYKDKSIREFLQKIYRALRSKDDHVYILSPDSRVIDEVKNLQRRNNQSFS
ncbi:MAG: helicase C-terminal domain-containing protein [Nanoarchaeota archaeon]|nr:helicase C-terminal domain-containing protein [Nanoarchaeota archaeon]